MFFFRYPIPNTPYPISQQKNNDEDKGRSEMSGRPFLFLGRWNLVEEFHALRTCPRGFHPPLMYFALSGLDGAGWVFRATLSHPHLPRGFTPR